jgi:hypothetical protein
MVGVKDRWIPSKEPDMKFIIPSYLQDLQSFEEGDGQRIRGKCKWKGDGREVGDGSLDPLAYSSFKEEEEDSRGKSLEMNGGESMGLLKIGG